ANQPNGDGTFNAGPGSWLIDLTLLRCGCSEKKSPDQGSIPGRNAPAEASGMVPSFHPTMYRPRVIRPKEEAPAGSQGLRRWLGEKPGVAPHPCNFSSKRKFQNAVADPDRGS